MSANAEVKERKGSTESNSTGSFENVTHSLIEREASEDGHESSSERSRSGSRSRRSSQSSCTRTSLTKRHRSTSQEDTDRDEAGGPTLLEPPPPIPDITTLTEHEVKQLEDPFLAPLREEQKQYYNEEASNRAVNTLIIFSLMMFSMPFAVMYVTYHFLFQEYFHLPTDQSMLYAGLCGILCVFVIIFWFIKVAYDEEKEAEHRLKSEKKDD